MFLGIDLTSSAAIPSACVCLDGKLDLVYQGWQTGDDDIVEVVVCHSPRVLAIDAPLSLPAGLCCLEENCACQPLSGEKGRRCERELARLAMPCFFTTKRSIIKEMVYRGIRLKRRLEEKGFEVIEVYPYASKVRLFGRPPVPKSRRCGLEWLKVRLQGLPWRVPGLEQWDHNMCDAAIAAYTAYLYSRGMTEAVGKAEDGVIHIPREAAGTA